MIYFLYFFVGFLSSLILVLPFAVIKYIKQYIRASV